VTPREVADNVVADLRDGGVTVGDANATTRVDGQGEDLAPPYVVVFPLDDDHNDPGYGGSIGDPWGEIAVGIQGTCVGGSRGQAQWVARRMFDLLLAADRDWTVQVDASGPPVRDDTSGGPPLFYAYPRFTIHVGD